MTAPTLTPWTDTPEAARMSCPECEGYGGFSNPDPRDVSPYDNDTVCEVCDGEGEVEATVEWLRDAADIIGAFAYELAEAIEADAIALACAEPMKVAA